MDGKTALVRKNLIKGLWWYEKEIEMNIEIGKYYITGKNNPVYIFGYDTPGEGVSYPSDMDLNHEKLVNAFGMKYLDRLDASRSLDFCNCIETITIYKDTHEAVDEEWHEFEPDQETRKRFEATSGFLDVIRVYIGHMQQQYLYKYPMMSASKVFYPEQAKLWALQQRVKKTL